MPDPAMDLSPFAAELRVKPGSKVDLDAIDPGGTPGFEGERDAAEVELKVLRDELTDFQERLWAEKGQSLLVVLQAMDGGGKDGTIRKVFTAFNPRARASPASACRRTRSWRTTSCGASI